MDTPNEEKITVVKSEDGEFYWKPLKTRKEDAEVPAWLFYGYVEARTKLRDIKDDINSYFK